MVFSDMYCDAIDPPMTAMAVAIACPKMAPVATPAADTPHHHVKAMQMAHGVHNSAFVLILSNLRLSVNTYSSYSPKNLPPVFAEGRAIAYVTK